MVKAPGTSRENRAPGVDGGGVSVANRVEIVSPDFVHETLPKRVGGTGPLTFAVDNVADDLAIFGPSAMGGVPESARDALRILETFYLMAGVEETSGTSGLALVDVLDETECLKSMGYQVGTQVDRGGLIVSVRDVRGIKELGPEDASFKVRATTVSAIRAGLIQEGVQPSVSLIGMAMRGDADGAPPDVVRLRFSFLSAITGDGHETKEGFWGKLQGTSTTTQKTAFGLSGELLEHELRVDLAAAECARTHLSALVNASSRASQRMGSAPGQPSHRITGRTLKTFSDLLENAKAQATKLLKKGW